MGYLPLDNGRKIQFLDIISDSTINTISINENIPLPQIRSSGKSTQLDLGITLLDSVPKLFGMKSISDIVHTGRVYFKNNKVIEPGEDPTPLSIVSYYFKNFYYTEYGNTAINNMEDGKLVFYIARYYGQKYGNAESFIGIKFGFGFFFEADNAKILFDMTDPQDTGGGGLILPASPQVIEPEWSFLPIVYSADSISTSGLAVFSSVFNKASLTKGEQYKNTSSIYGLFNRKFESNLWSYPTKYFNYTMYNSREGSLVSKYCEKHISTRYENIYYYQGIVLSGWLVMPPIPIELRGTEYDIQLGPYTPYSPYDPADPSTSGGGDGSFDNKSDPVDFTELPSLSVVDSGFAGLFKPTLSQLNALANYLWNEDINFDQLKKLVANPIDLLISLTIMPVDPPTAGSENIKVGFIDTGISINKIENQYMAIDFGSLEVKEYYGNALDYSPYTKISIYLPYIGLKQLNTDDVMKKTLALRYNVDLFTGACVAEIKAGESVLYTFTGNIANQIPLNAESFNSFLSGLIQAAASVGVAIASHGTSVATQGAAEAGEATAMAARGAQTASNLASMNAALTSAGAVATSKPDILHSGSMTANNGYLSGKTPYLIYEVPRACIPENYQTFVGYPSNITKALSEVTGFTVVDSIHLENIPATDRELAEIERLLKGGVIL